MRILHLILSQGFAGSERYAAELATIQSADHDVMLVIRQRQASSSGASIHAAIGPKVRTEAVPPYFFTGRHVARLVREFRPDVVHTHLRRAARVVVRGGLGVPTIATLHIRVNGPHFLELDGLICNAHWQVREIPKTYRGRVFKLNQLFTPHRRLEPAEVAALRAEVGVAPHEFLVGCVARLAHSKGLDTLIDAFEAARMPDSKLVIFGEGRERKRLERRLGKNALLAGFRRNVKDYYQAFDLFVCPSRREPLPLVMLEAFDAGVPIVASTADGCRELIEEYTGDLFPVEDVPALADLLRKHHRERPGRRQVDLSPHYISNVSAAILGCYAQLLEGRAAH